MSATVWAWAQTENNSARTTVFMTALVHFKCRACDGDLSIPPSSAKSIKCPHCGAELPLFMDDSILGQGIVTTCVSCGHDTLYVQKDFSRQAGIAIVGLGIALSIFFFARNQPIFAMASLGLTALVDFLA